MKPYAISTCRRRKRIELGGFSIIVDRTQATAAADDARGIRLAQACCHVSLHWQGVGCRSRDQYRGETSPSESVLALGDHVIGSKSKRVLIELVPSGDRLKSPGSRRTLCIALFKLFCSFALFLLGSHFDGSRAIRSDTGSRDNGQSRRLSVNESSAL